MNHVQEKVCAASASHIIYDYGSCQHAVFPMMQRLRELPACCFPDDAEATFDRSFEYFSRLVQEEKI